MNFCKNNIEYTINRTDCTTCEGTPIWKWCAWNNQGQMIDTGEIAENCIEYAKNKLMEA